MKYLLAVKGIPHVVNAFGSVFHLMFTEQQEVTHFDQFLKRNAALYSRFAEAALTEGVALRPSGLWYVSAAHTEKDVYETLERLERVIRKL